MPDDLGDENGRYLSTTSRLLQLSAVFREGETPFELTLAVGSPLIGRNLTVCGGAE